MQRVARYRGAVIFDIFIRAALPQWGPFQARRYTPAASVLVPKKDSLD